jgi:hypothetical protein
LFDDSGRYRTDYLEVNSLTLYRLSYRATSNSYTLVFNSFFNDGLNLGRIDGKNSASGGGISASGGKIFASGGISASDATCADAV